MSVNNLPRQHGFPRQARLRKAADFDRVYGAKVYAADDVLVMNGCKSDLDRTRLGLSVSRKVGNAVVRNQWKRLIREAFRMQQVDLPRGLDLVVRPCRGATPDFHSIRSSLRTLAERIVRRLAEDRR